MTEKPFVSVIIPTYNRSEVLRQTVDSFLAQTYPRDRWELILVDNASTDDTAKVIEEIAGREANVKALSETRRGAHNARNSGALAAHGEVLYFTDDDMIAEPDLIENILAGFVEGSNVGSVTGKVLPRWDTEPPAWVLEHCKNALLSLIDLGNQLTVSDDDPGVFSCHQAVLREAFMRAGGFNPDTNAGEFTGDNETGLNLKIKALGYRFAYVGASVTHHMIPASRLTQAYLNSRFADQGFCDSYTDFRRLHPGKGRLARRIAAYLALGGLSGAKALARRAVGDSAWRVDFARTFYYRNRARYDGRLAAKSEWREFALRDNWLGSAEQPLVSVITVVHNGAAHLSRTIRAVAEQTYPNVEHIVIDGASTDGTVDIIRANDATIGYWISEPDNGIYDAMNKGIELVTDRSSYIIFANSDDQLHSPAAIADAMKAGQGADLIYGRMLLGDGNISGVVGHAVTVDDLARQTICHPSTFVRREVFDRVGKFDTAYRVAADYDHIVRCFSYPVSTRFVDVIVSDMSMGGTSESSFMESCRERKEVVRRRFKGMARLAGVWQVNLYDIPRNTTRHWLDRVGLLGQWRAMKRS